MAVTFDKREITIQKVEVLRTINMIQQERVILLEPKPERVIQLTGVGIQGIQGPEGPRGAKGEQGIQGIQGIQGLKGDKGDKGDKGEPGLDGADSTVPGPQGETGERGPQGEKGDKGDQGIQGLKGDQGEIGPQGERGLQGIQGVKGDMGAKGDTGDRGEIGPKGDQGIQGIQGLKGDKGDKGEPGDTMVSEGNPGEYLLPDGGMIWTTNNFAPSDYDRKTDQIAAARISGVLDLSQIPVLPSQKQVVSSGDLTALTGAQQAEIGQGTLVTIQNGNRYVYSGTGSKTDVGSYVLLADITPTWLAIEDKPSAFPSTVPLVSGLQTALDGKASLTGNVSFGGSVSAVSSINLSNTAGTNRLFRFQTDSLARWAMYADSSAESGANAGSFLRIARYDDAGAQIDVPFLMSRATGRLALTVRPTFNGATPWDSANFDPALKADAAAPVFTGKATFGGDVGIQANAPFITGGNIFTTTTNLGIGTQGAQGLRFYTNNTYRGGFTSAGLFELTGESRFAGNLTIAKVTPIIALEDSNATGALGKFRFYSAANNFYFTRNTHATSAWATETTIFSVASGTGALNFANRPTFAGSVPWDAANFDPSTKANAANPVFTGTGSIPVLNVSGAFSSGQATVSSLVINRGLLYADGNHTVLRSGAVGADKYWRFDANGTFYSLNAGVDAAGTVRAGVSMIVGPNEGAANSTSTGPGYMELRSSAFGAYIDFSNADANTMDFGGRIQFTGANFIFQRNVGSNVALDAGGNIILNAQAGVGSVYANGAAGQAGAVLTREGTEQVLAKQITFPSTQNPQDAGASAMLEVRGEGGGYGAWMKFHRPGAYGTYFGMFDGGRFGFGGWSTGGQIFEFWTAANQPVTVEPTADTLARRTSSGKLKANSFVAHPGADGVGYRYWQDDDSYGNWMSNANNTTYGGRVPGETTSDYNLYFTIKGGTNRGWNFSSDAGVVQAGIDAAGRGRFGAVYSRSEVYVTNWVRGTTAAGYYWEGYGRGFSAPELNGHSYGHIAPYGVGRNSWHGYNLGSNNRHVLMTNTDNQWGFYNPESSVWMMTSDSAGNVTFNGNVTAYSDLRLKVLEGDGKITNVRERRDNLAEAAIMYRRKDAMDRVRIGYGAQTLRDGANPELVHEADDALKLALGMGTLSVDYGESAAILAVSGKETDDRVDALEKRIAELEAFIKRLMADD